MTLSPPSATKPKVLCVDDEPLVLEGLSVRLRRFFEMRTAASGAAGLEALASEGPFSVVVSDMRMPVMDGATFLSKVHERYPDTTRILLTGQTDIEAAITAVNQGQIFRFLTKPCPADVLQLALRAGARQNELLLAERVLLEQTLRGSIAALSEVLSISNPKAFGRAARALRHMEQLSAALGRSLSWEAEVAAMLSQIGCVALPPETLDRYYRGEALCETEVLMVDKLPRVVDGLLGHIPRIDRAREILAHIEDQFAPGPSRRQSVRGEAIPWESRALKLIFDYYTLEAQRDSASLAFEALRGRTQSYDPALLEAFRAIVGAESGGRLVREVTVTELRPGMTLVENVTTRAGALLMPKGHQVSRGLIERIENFARTTGVREPILVHPPHETKTA